MKFKTITEERKWVTRMEIFIKAVIIDHNSTAVEDYLALCYAKDDLVEYLEAKSHE